MVGTSRHVAFAVKLISREGDYSARSIADASLEIPGVRHVKYHPESDQRAWLVLGYPIGVDIENSGNIIIVRFYEHNRIRYEKSYQGDFSDLSLLVSLLSSVEQIAADYAPVQKTS